MPRCPTEFPEGPREGLDTLDRIKSKLIICVIGPNLIGSRWPRQSPHLPSEEKDGVLLR